MTTTNLIDPTDDRNRAGLRRELETAVAHMTDARAALERALRLDGDGFMRAALRLAAGDVDSVARRVRNAAELARPRRRAA